MKLLNVTIGIPAHNEGENIVHLLTDVLAQQTKALRVSEIIVISDGSTDDTVSLAKTCKDKRIKIHSYHDRKGKAFRQNQIIAKSSGDILVILDADIVISDKKFLERLVAPIVHKKADMTSAAICELPARSFFESVLGVSMELKHRLFASFRNGNNFYTCHGPARAFSKRLYEQLDFPVNEGEDMYSYLSCVARGLRFKAVKNAFVHYRLPNSFDGHRRQSIRYLKAKQLYVSLFDADFVDQEMHIPISVYWKGLVGSLDFIVTHPIHVGIYTVVLVVMNIYSIRPVKTREMWKVSSSKVLR